MSRNYTRQELINCCREQGIKGYSSKNKDELIQLLTDNNYSFENNVPIDAPRDALRESSKKEKGQFYTTNCDYILGDFPIPSGNCSRIIEPFAGSGDLLDWLSRKGNTIPVEAYDIDPKRSNIIQRDTLKNPPNYTGSWVITNPPYLARNKTTSKEIFDMYETNDLYKCFIKSICGATNCVGGIMIIPAGFFFSPRDIDVQCRNRFLSKYRVLQVRYFEEQVFTDTPTTVVAILFEKTDDIYINQDIEWIRLPVNYRKTFRISKEENWIIGGDIYNLYVPSNISVRRHVEGIPLKDGEQQTYMTIHALDTGMVGGEIHMEYKEGHVYPAKDCSRSYATLRITGRTLTADEQQRICRRFNEFIDKKRAETWSLFLPQYRESKEYARKRIPFELVYTIVLHIIHTLFD